MGVKYVCSFQFSETWFYISYTVHWCCINYCNPLFTQVTPLGLLDLVSVLRYVGRYTNLSVCVLYITNHIHMLWLEPKPEALV